MGAPTAVLAQPLVVMLGVVQGQQQAVVRVLVVVVLQPVVGEMVAVVWGQQRQVVGVAVLGQRQQLVVWVAVEWMVVQPAAAEVGGGVQGEARGLAISGPSPSSLWLALSTPCMSGIP
ncbi:hypothetical protein [Bosea sp. (in: a-proteobacteria)]|uniref:hypothetical protein n=1 Tax=Bosea sp. (in: a-proteobacteria) TaxID=1871050 RepID=UPI004033A139